MKFGIMINSSNIDFWQFKCITELINNNENTLNLIIINNSDKSKKKGDIAFKVYHKLFVLTEANSKVNIKKLKVATDSIKCKIEKKGIGEFFEKADIEHIKKYNLDFILRFGFGIIRGDILKSTKYGVWSFHHGDEMHYRGRPAGFWEIYEKNTQTGVILQKLTEKLDGGIILKKGIYKTVLSSYNKNINQILLDSSIWPRQVCNYIKNDKSYIDNLTCSSTKSRIYKYPNIFEIVTLIMRSGYRKLAEKINIIFYEDAWNVGLIEESIEDIIKNKKITNKITWIRVNSKEIFIADPFISCVKKRKIKLLVEEYKYSNRKGMIKEIVSDFNGNIINNKTMLEFSSHISYPFLMTHNNINYCIPETVDLNKVELYTYKEEIKKTSVLINEGVIDSTFFLHEGYWWCLGTKQTEGSNLKLYCWYSKDIEGEWKEHNNNPIKHNITSSRSAGGIIKIGNEIYRPSQNCAESYGSSITINKIIKLSPYEFIEEEVFSIKPKKNDYYQDGLHTINCKDGIVAIDGKNRVFSVKKPLYKIIKRIQSNR